MNPGITAPAAPTAPPSPLRWLRRLGWLAGILFVLLIFALGGLRWWLDRYLHSAEFRRRISAQTAGALQAEGEYLPLHWAGYAAYTDGFAARGRAESFLLSVRADQIRAEVDVTGWLPPQWQISHLEIQRLNATLKKPTSVAASEAGTRGSRARVGPITIQEANLHWPMDDVLTGSVRHVQARIELTEDGWQTAGQGGELLVPGWPALKVDQFRLQGRVGAVYVKESQFRLTEGGRLELSGEVPLGPGPDFQMQVRYAEVPVRNWLPLDWRGAMSGLAAGSAQVQGSSLALATVTVTGQINVTGGKLEALPILDRIALFTQTEQFRSVQLQKASADYEWQGKKLTIRNLLLESPALLRIEGGCVVDQEIMDGEFDVGVAAATLQWLPGARTQVFTVDRAGYLWTKVKVRGPLRNLQEDLSGRLVSAAGKEIIDSGKTLIEQGTKTFFDLLKKTPGL